MGRKINRFTLLITICSTVGVILGGTAGWAESNQCLEAETPTEQCLSGNPLFDIVEGMSTGMVAGAGAAIAASWRLRQKD